MNPKQVIIIRKDLNMRTGKIVSQACHASMAVILNLMNDELQFGNVRRRDFYTDAGSALDVWLEGKFTKICVYVNSEHDLLAVYNTAKRDGILCALIEDEGLTEFKGVKTITCCAIGPDYPEKLNPLTGHLPLL